MNETKNPRRSLLRRILIWSGAVLGLLLLVAAADWLFYAAPAGLSFACFFLLLAGAVLLTNPVKVTRRRLARAAAILVVFLLPEVENPGTVAVLLGAGGVA